MFHIFQSVDSDAAPFFPPPPNLHSRLLNLMEFSALIQFNPIDLQLKEAMPTLSISALEPGKSSHQIRLFFFGKKL
jgi:hypothetical protein